jgi:hypothetical protein
MDKKRIFLFVKFEGRMSISVKRNPMSKKKWHFSGGNATDRTTQTEPICILNSADTDIVAVRYIVEGGYSTLSSAIPIGTMDIRNLCREGRLAEFEYYY